MRRREMLSAGAMIAPAAMIGTVARAQDAPPQDGSLLKSGGSFVNRRSGEKPGITDLLATHAATCPADAIDPAALLATRHRLLDTIGCAFGGTLHPRAAALADVLRDSGGKGEAVAVGYPFRLPAAQAALLNAVSARAYDFEVMTVVIDRASVPSHHSPTTVMTALALAEREGASGLELLAALTIGDDIAARMLVAAGLDFEQGWDGAPVFSAIAATAIAGRLLKLNPFQMRDAFGICVDQIAGTVQNIWDGATDFKLPQGLVGRAAILSAELAKRGWTGIGDALLAPYGFYAQYTAGCARPEILSADLGKRFHGESYFKPYPACMATHCGIEAGLALREPGRLSEADVLGARSITIEYPAGSLTGFVAKPFVIGRDAHADANFSYQFASVNALLRGSMWLDHYDEAAVRSPQIAALAAKSKLAPLPAGMRGSRVTVELADGRTESAHVPIASRHPMKQVSSEAEILAKFHRQTHAAGMTKARSDRLAAALLGLHGEKSVRPLVRLLGPAKA